MKKIRYILFSIILLIGIGFVLNINVTTQRGINYQLRTIKIPLYLKTSDFFNRHFNYKQLIRGVVKGIEPEDKRVMKVLRWTYENMRRVPTGFPIIDDHVWYTIIRGYGADDQFSDVFSTLCSYAGLDAFFSWIYTKDRTKCIALSFVKVNGAWTIFDPYRGAYFKNAQGGLADLEAIRSNKGWILESYGGIPEIDYRLYFNNLPSIKEAGLVRPRIQSPVRRLLFGIKQWIRPGD